MGHVNKNELRQHFSIRILSLADNMLQMILITVIVLIVVFLVETIAATAEVPFVLTKVLSGFSVVHSFESLEGRQCRKHFKE